MKKLLLAAIAAMTLGAGVESAQAATATANAAGNQTHWTLSNPNNFDIPGG